MYSNTKNCISLKSLCEKTALASLTASRFDKFDSLESYQNFNFAGYKKKDIPSITYHVSYDEWYNQLTKYDDDEMKALFDQHKI